MVDGLNWGSIKNGFQGFEHLAYDFVQAAFPSPSSQRWSKTRETQDGNRDAYSVILGYQPTPLSAEEWWMEAKYSTKKEVLPRYRLDATIVSAAIEGNVSKVIFVTNISISTKTIVDIRLALHHSLQCRDVHFCTKNTLEYWLLNNPKIFKKYFYKPDRDKLRLAPLFLIEGLEFYSEAKRRQSFCEPLETLRTKHKYHLYFSLFSGSSQELRLSIASGLRGIHLCSGENIDVSEGENQIIAEVELSEQYEIDYKSPGGKTTIRTDFLDGTVFKLGEIEIITKRPLDVISNTNMPLEIQRQKRILTLLQESFLSFKKNQSAVIHSIYGNSGTGKSFLLIDFINSELLLDRIVLFITFSADSLVNDKRICELLLFILFPYLAFGSIDSDYLKEIQATHRISEFVLQSVAAKDKPDVLHKLYFGVSWETEIFPDEISINERIIILDDMQKLHPDTAKILYIILAELKRKKIPVFVVLSGWPDFRTLSEYGVFRERTTLNEHEYALVAEDLITAFTQTYPLSFQLTPQLCNVIFPSVIDLLQFIKYYDNIKHGTFTLEDFLLACRMFINGQIAEEYILEPFLKLFQGDSCVKALCNQIYWSISGVVAKPDRADAARKLLKNSLVKYSENGGRLVPYHDHYQQIYRRRILKTSGDTPLSTGNPYEDLHNVLFFSVDIERLRDAAKDVLALKELGRYYSLLYILENVFEGDDKNLLRGKLGDVLFYKLYLAYGFGIANQSRTKSGKDVFAQICLETCGNGNMEVQLTCMDATFELINSSYEWLDHKQAEKHIKDLLTLVAKLQMFGYVDKDINRCEKYILSRSIKMLMLSDQNQPVAEEEFRSLETVAYAYCYNYEALFFKLRYAETLYFRDTDAAFGMVQACMVGLKELRGQEEKFYLWAKMDYHFLDMILHDQTELIQEVIKDHQELKRDCYNDYRKRVFVLASYFYSYGLIEEGNRYFFSDIVVARDLRPRQKAFYYETLALYEALNNNGIAALSALQEAAKLFAELPTYLGIIQHNQRLLESGQFSRCNIRFCRNGILEPGIYSLDPRCIW